MIFINNMANDNPGFPVLNGDVKHWEGACVGPTNLKNCEPNFHAFAQEDSMMELVPPSVMVKLKDKSNWSNRLSAANEVERILKQPSTAITNDNLKCVVELMLNSISDSQSKVSQKGLQVMIQLVSIVGKRILVFVPALTPKILAKMGSNKGDLKRLGMALFKVLMEAVGPAKVIVEVSSCGLTHKTSRVREEAINVMILALFHCQTSGVHLPSVARELVVCMVDSKPKVRQAAFEAVALLTSKLDSSEFNQVVALVVDAHSRYKLQHPSDLSLTDAYYARLERHAIPALDEHNMVKYSVMLLCSDGSISQAGPRYTGADVDWIIAPLRTSVPSQTPVELASNGKITQRSSSPSFRPYRSAGKRPWEMEGQMEVTSSSTSPPGPPTFSAEPPARPSILSPRFAPRTSSISTTSGTAPAGMKLPHNSYMDMHLSKIGKTNTPAPVVPNHVPAVNPSAHHIPVLDSLKPRSGKNFFVHIASMNGRDPQSSVPQQNPSPSMEDAPIASSDDPSSSMSMTWPRATLCLSGTPSRVPSVLSARTGPQLGNVAPLPLKGPTQINADTISLVESQNSVKTSFSRPHSKPRVRNPLSSLKHSPQPKSFVAGSGGVANMSQENALQLEQEFLNGNTSSPHPWMEQSFDEEYFAIPEDTTILNSSLSASLSSLCNKDSDQEVDKLKHIRKEAATRKALLLSTTSTGADCQHVSGSSFSNTPRLSSEPESPTYTKMRVPPLDKDLSVQHGKKGLGLLLDSKPPPIPMSKKWNNSSECGREDKSYNKAYLKKLAGTPTKSLKPANQKLAPQLPVTLPEEAGLSGVNAISLEGRGLDQSVEKPIDMPKKRVRKDQLLPNRGRTTISTSLFQEEAGIRRPTIERGGTNTISMEVSGIGSRNSAENLGQPLLSKNNEESSSPRKTASDFDVSKKKSHSAVYPNNSHDPPLVVEEADESIGAIASAPIETTHKRNKKKKSGHASSPQKGKGDKLNALDKHTYGWNDRDLQSSGVGTTLMEMDLSLLESHVQENPEQAVKTALQSLAKVEWTDKCDGIGLVVVIARRYPYVLQSQLHHVLIALQKEVKNLRSSVAKKATECLGYLFSTMKRAMEADLDQVVQVLLQKSGESNTFLRDLVEKALHEMVTNVSLQKALVALISGGMTNRNTQIRKVTAKYVCVAIEFHEPSRFLHSNKDVLERALLAIVQLTKDSSPDCRYYGRKCLNMLWPEPDYNQVASRVLKNDLYTEARDAVEILKVKGVGDPPAEFKSHPSSTSTSRHPTGGSTRMPNTAIRDSQQDSPSPSTSSSPGLTSIDTPKKQRKQFQQQAHGREPGLSMPSQTVLLPDGLLERLQSNMWNERYEAISQLETYVVNARPQTLSAHLQRVFDAFTSKLTDRNSKVTLHALQAFAKMVPLMHSALIPIINNILSTLVNNLASRNATLHSTAMTVLNLLSEHIDPVILIPSVANSSQYGNARVQPIMTKRLASLTRIAYRQKPQLVSRHVLPVVWHHVKTPMKGEARLALQELCSVLQECMQQGFLDSAAHLSVEDNIKLKELLDWDENSR